MAVGRLRSLSRERGAMIYKATTLHIHTYCGEKDMYHFSQMSLQRVRGALNKILAREESVVCLRRADPIRNQITASLQKLYFFFF